MKTLKNKIAAITIALFFILSMTASTMLVPNASAQAAPGKLTIPSYVYISAFPTPVGVGQTISLFAWQSFLPETANGAYGDRYTNLTIIVTLPDGTKTTLGPYTSDPVGTIFETYTPLETGNYTFQFIFPGYLMTGNPVNPTQVAESQAYATAHNVSLATAEAIYIQGYSFIGDYLEPATSTISTVNVQSSAIPPAAVYALPTEYWSIPVSQPGHSSTWQYIMGDWLSFTTYESSTNDYSSPPETSHIEWTTPMEGFAGGVAGNTEAGQGAALNNGGDNYYTGMSYQTQFGTAIIMNGQLYYNVGGIPSEGFVDLNLQTGQQVYYQNGTLGNNAPLPNYDVTGAASNTEAFGGGSGVLSFGQELDFEAPNQHGTIDYLWSTYQANNGSYVWTLYNPQTGAWICNLWNVPAISSNAALDNGGDIIIYTPHFGANNILSVWNSTQVILDTYPNLYPPAGYWEFRPPVGQNIDGSGNTLAPANGPVGQVIGSPGVTTPAGSAILLPGNTNYTITGNLPANAASYHALGYDAYDQEMIYSNIPATLTYPTPTTFSNFAISVAPSSIGQVMWSQTYPWPAGNLTVETSGQAWIGNGVFAFFWKEDTSWMGFNAKTGAEIWTTTAPEINLHMYGVTGGIFDGVLYSGDSLGTGGNVYAYNVTNGDLIFDYTSGSFEYNGYWINIPTGIGEKAADNLYTYGSEHSPGPNLEPGELLGAINATNGQSIWNITFWANGVKVADDYAIALNNYDGQIYAFSMGPTQTTVQTPLAGVTTGQPLVIQGTVMDISPGTKQTAVALRFPNGIAAVSDASMTAYMEYVYMQNPKPANTTGVPVDITLIDPNGNTHELGTITSDMSGMYRMDVTSSMTPVPGMYTVIATFAGTDGYWPSSSESTFVVAPAASATPVPTATPTSVADMYFVPMSIGIIVLIIAVAIVLVLLMLRKKP